jgi:hypothetical protein
MTGDNGDVIEQRGVLHGPVFILMIFGSSADKVDKGGGFWHAYCHAHLYIEGGAKNSVYWKLDRMVGETVIHIIQSRYKRKKWNLMH